MAYFARVDTEESSAQAEAVSSRGVEAMASAEREGVLVKQQQPKPPAQERARRRFMDDGYFDEAVQELRSAISPQQRAAAALALGEIGSKRGTPHLIAAMFDEDPEVRNAAEEALAQLSGPTVSSSPVNDLPGSMWDLEESRAAQADSFDGNAAQNGTATKNVRSQHKSGRDALGPPDDDEALTQESTVHGNSTRSAANTGSSSASEEFDPMVQHTAQRIVRQQSHHATREDSQETSQETIQPEIFDDADASKEAEQLLLEEQAVRETVNQLEQQLLDAAAVRTALEKATILSVERESRLRAEAAIRRREEEELWKQADEEGERRRSQEREALQAEQAARVQAETEAHRIAEEEARTRLETSNLRKVAQGLVWRRVGVETAQIEAAEAARRSQAKRSREEAEERHDAELTRLHNDEEALRAATDEAALRRAEVENAHKYTKAEIERLTRERVELEAVEAVRHAEATRLRQEAKTLHEAEVTGLRDEEQAFRALTEQVAQLRADVGVAHRDAEDEVERLIKERAQLAAAEVARRAETERVREAEERNRADHEQLRLELEGLHLAAQEIAARHVEVEAARRKADEEAERLLETQARMRAEEEASARAESERVQLEAEIHEQMKTQQRLLEEARLRAQEEQERLDEESRRHAEHEEQRRAKLELFLKNAEIIAQQRAEEEQQILSKVDSLRIANAEARKRIEEVEARRRKSEDAYRLVMEKIVRVEAEAQLRANEEEQVLAKLEEVRRSAAVAAQTRAEQEKRIKEEIEQLRKLEGVERPRLEVAALQMTQAQGLLQQVKDRAVAEETRARAEGQLEVVEAQPQANTSELSSTQHRLKIPDEPKRRLESPERAPSRATDDREKGAISTDAASAPAVTPAIRRYLNNVDPFKRAAAVAELARSNAKDAFDLIAKCFDDLSPHVRNAAARALLKLEPTRTVDLFSRALEGAAEERRRNIGSAIAASGLASEAISNLVSENREDTYNALSLLFVMAKTGQVQPLVQAIQEHPNGEISVAVVKLLTLSGHSEIANEALKRRAPGTLVSKGEQ